MINDCQEQLDALQARFADAAQETKVEPATAETEGALLMLETAGGGLALARDLFVAAFDETRENPRRLFLADLYSLLGRQLRELEEMQSVYRRWVLGEGTEEVTEP